MIEGALNGLITGIVTALVVGLIYLLGKFAGGGTQKKDGETILRYSGFFRGVGFLGVLFALVIFVVFAIGRITGEGAQEDGALLAVGGLIGGSLLISVPLLIEGYRRQITLTEDGIAARGWFGPISSLQWSEIESVENRMTSGKFVIRGGKVKISIGHYMAGLEVLTEECKKRLAPEVYGEAFDKPINRPFM